MTTLLAFVIGLAAGIFVTAPLILIMSRTSIQRARDSERRARQAEHLADVGTLTGGLAHEIRNPLSTLTLNLQLLREDLIRPGQTADRRVAAKLDVIEQEARRLQTILDDFLQFAGKHELRLAVQPINPILEEAVAFYRERFQRRSIEVRTRFAEGLPPVAVDPARFKQAVSNLLLNAEAAMPHGGELLLGTEPDRGGVRVHVTDTGHGIPPQDLDKIFAPYYSTRPGGTGLGLPTVRRIVQEHEAALEVHSDLGKGTQFTIRLPAAARAVPVPGPAAPAVPQA